MAHKRPSYEMSTCRTCLHTLLDVPYCTVYSISCLRTQFKVFCNLFKGFIRHLRGLYLFDIQNTPPEKPNSALETLLAVFSGLVSLLLLRPCVRDYHDETLTLKANCVFDWRNFQDTEIDEKRYEINQYPCKNKRWTRLHRKRVCTRSIPYTVYLPITYVRVVVYMLMYRYCTY